MLAVKKTRPSAIQNTKCYGCGRAALGFAQRGLGQHVPSCGSCGVMFTASPRYIATRQS